MKKKSIIFIVFIMLIICITASGCFTNTKVEKVELTSNNFVFEKVLDKVLNSTVTIQCSTSSGGISGGAGVVVSSNGYILTNYHVIKDATNGTANVTFPNSSLSYKAEIISEKNDGSKYANWDLALLKVNSVLAGDFTPVELKQGEVKWGEYGVIVGNPKQLGSLAAHAMVSNPKKKLTHQVGNKSSHIVDFITLDAPVNQGNSGGGFFDSNGKLAGIVTLRQYNGDNNNKDVIFGIGYAIPASDVSAYLARYDLS